MKRRALQPCCGCLMTLVFLTGAMCTDTSSQEITSTEEGISSTPTPTNDTEVPPTESITMTMDATSSFMTNMDATPSFMTTPPSPSFMTTPPSPSFMTTPPSPSFMTTPPSPSFMTTPPSPSTNSTDALLTSMDLLTPSGAVIVTPTSSSGAVIATPTSAGAPSGTTETTSISGTTPSISETTPSISGTTPSISETPPSISGTTPSISGTTPSISGTTPSISGTTPSISGTTPSIPGTTPSISGTTPSISGTTPSIPGTTPAESLTTLVVYVSVFGGIVVLVLVLIVMILTCYCVCGYWRRRTQNVYFTASLDEKKKAELTVIELQPFTYLDKSSQDCLGSLGGPSQMSTDPFTGSLPHLSPISYSSQLVSEFTKEYAGMPSEGTQPPLPLAPRGAGQRSMSTSHLAKFPDTSTSLAEPTRMALSLGLSMEDLPYKLSSKSTTPPHSAHTSTELKQLNSTTKLSSLGMADDGLKKRATSPALRVAADDMVPTPGSPRPERPPNAPAPAPTKQAVPAGKTLQGLIVIPNEGAGGTSSEEVKRSSSTQEPPAAPLYPITSMPDPPPKEPEVKQPPLAPAVTVIKKPMGRKLDLEALTSVTLPGSTQAKERAVTFSEPSKELAKVTRKNTVSDSSVAQGSSSKTGEEDTTGKKTRHLSRLEKLTSLDYIRASLRARKKKVSFSVADRKPSDIKKPQTKHTKESVTIYNRHTSLGRSSPPPMFSPEGYEEEDVFGPDLPHPFARRHSGHDAALGYPQLSQPIFMPAYGGGFVQLSQTYYPALSQGIPYPQYASNHLHPLHPEPIGYYDDLTPEEGYPEPRYAELDPHHRNDRDWSPDAHTDTSHTSEQHEDPDNTLVDGLLHTERSPQRLLAAGSGTGRRGDVSTWSHSPQERRPSSHDLDDSFRSPARLLNSDSTPHNGRELDSGNKPKSKPRVSWKPSVEYHSRTPDPDCDEDAVGSHL